VTVEIVDLMTTLKNLVTIATKQIYLGTLKISPKFYEMLFKNTENNEWPVKVLNLLSVPFMQQEFRELLEEKEPCILVSTYPVWSELMKKVWVGYCKEAGCKKSKKMPFISVVTDSISIHHVWTTGNPDYFIVANDDTKTALKHFGIQNKRIKVLGYPVAKSFETSQKSESLQGKLDLSPKKKTLLAIFSTGISWSKIKSLAEVIKHSRLKNLQLVIIAAVNKNLEKKLKQIAWPWPTRITGWTNEMHTFIQGADIVLTKAGGSTVMECIAAKKPMMIIDAIPGHEMGNAMLVTKYNLGAVMDGDFNGFDETVEYIFANKNLIDKNLSAQQKPHAAETIAKFLLGNL
jgi:processive 1,2-diacylglycerol beta-glucosyltransferase